MPGRGIDLPELLTWTLGERSEFVPQLRARRAPPTEPPLPTPPLPAAAARAAVAEMIRKRLTLATGAGADRDGDGIADSGDACPDSPEDRDGFEDQDGCPDADRRAAQQRQAPARSRTYRDQAEFGAAKAMAMPAPSAAPAMAPPPPPEAAMAEAAPDDMEELESAPAIRRSRLGQALRQRRRRTTSVPLALDDTPAPARGPVLSRSLPARGQRGRARLRLPGTDEGDDRRARPKQVARPARVADVPRHRLPRGDAGAGARPRSCARACATTASGRCCADRRRSSATASWSAWARSRPPGPGGDIEFPLGADQDVKLVRQVVPTTKTTGVIMKSDETTYDVQIQVANYKKQKVTVEIVDQVPRSRRDKVEVKLLGVQPAATGAPDADGVVRWRVELAPGATQTFKLRYQITRPKDWQLYQN